MYGFGSGLGRNWQIASATATPSLPRFTQTKSGTTSSEQKEPHAAWPLLCHLESKAKESEYNLS